MWTWMLFIAAALAVVLAFGGRSLVNAGKSLYAEHLAGKARAALEKEDYMVASRELSQANRFHRENPAVLRVTRDFLQKTGSEPRGLLVTLKAMREAGISDADDLLLLGQTHMQLGEAAEAREILEQLTPEQRESKAGLELLAGIRRAEGHVREAEDILRRALMADPDDPDSKLRLAALDYTNTFPEIHRRARATMWELAEKQDDTALKAIRFLAEDKDLSAPEVERLVEVVGAHPDAGVADRFKVLSAMIRIQPQRRDAILDEEMKAHEGKGVEDMLPFLSWLATEKQHTRLLKMVPPNMATNSPELFPLVAQALGEEGRWADLKRLLTGGGRIPVSRGRVEVWLAEAASHLTPKDTAQVRSHLTSAVKFAMQAEDPATLVAASMVADRLGMYDLAIQCYQSLGGLSQKLKANMAERTYELAQRSRDTALLVKVSQELLEERPSSGVYRDRLNYLRLLLGEEIELTERRLEDEDANLRWEGADARIPIPLLRALAAYRLRDVELVKREIQTLGSEVGDLPPGPRAVAAGLMATCGRDVEAFRLAERIPSEVLLDSERRFFERAVQ